MDKIKGLSEFIQTTEYREALGLPAWNFSNPDFNEKYEMLAQGEYNLNYLFTHPVTGQKLVLRVECGSQLHLDNQIQYEAEALKLISESGHTPKVYYYDATRNHLDHGILVEEFLPGDHLDYTDRHQLALAARALADIHSVSVASPPVTHLIDPGNSLGAIIDESEAMVQLYMDSNLADDKTKARIKRLIARGREMIEGVEDGDIYRCCINTELNNTNFLMDRDTDRMCVVDWEKPLYGDPAQDLGHFLTPTTTFWKTDVVWDMEKMDWFIDEYIRAVDGRFDTTGLKERTHKFITITCLRGITWCAMAWVEYQQPGRVLCNESTWSKLGCYISDPLLKDIEDIFGV